MQLKLNKIQVDYIFYHLSHHFFFVSEIKSKIVFDETNNKHSSKIIFQLSANKLKNIKYIDDIPILFPLSDTQSFYKFDQKNNLIFNDDLLKSAFYLLSGYQETQKYIGDKYNRFSYEESIQKKMDIASFPLVNHYFKVIIEGIEKFCEKNNILFKTKSIWGDKNFGFMLTHDVDRVDKYSFAQAKLKVKQLIGLSPSKLYKKDLLKHLFINLYKLNSKDNPFWNFEWMKSLEKKVGFKSVWFFLPQHDPKKDAYFSLKEERIKKLVRELKESGDEIGLHSTFNSYKNEKILLKNYFDIKEFLGTEPSGNRQHWLRFKYPDTLRQLEKIGIKYDSTWGFHDQPGWRNSYCLPFRPYDVEQDRMMNIWEFPLTVMDTTLYEYQNLSVNEASKSIDEIIRRVQIYNGLFVLLWHNNNFQLETGLNLTNFYIQLLDRIADKNPLSFIPSQLLNESTVLLNDNE